MFEKCMRIIGLGMTYYHVIPAAIAHAEHGVLTYESETDVAIGSIVAVPLGRRTVAGVVVRQVSKPDFPTKALGIKLEEDPLPEHFLKLAAWIAEYYATHPALVMQTMLPRGLGKKRRERTAQEVKHSRKRTNIVLNKAQSDALKTIEEVSPGTIMLRGITGSGKTQVYIEAAKKAFSNGRSSIVLVPEIALTSQVVAEFSHHFDNLIVTHSTMTEAERHLIWRRCLEAKEPYVVIGPRSALFCPLKDIGFIAVDECHEPSYKQEQAPRYSALRVASMMAKFCQAKAVFGSATPAVADYYLAEQSDRPVIRLDKRAVSGALSSDITLVDLTKRADFTKHSFISNQFIAKAEKVLERGEQILVFHNRRGSAPQTLCENCGWTAACPRCFLPLTLHTDTHRLRCHVCGFSDKVPPNCPDCGQPDIIHKGIGTKRIAEELAKLFPKYRLARFDSDTESAEQLHNQYQDLYDGKIQIIVGTQMIAKGLDLPKLRLVGVIQADGGLSLPDFQASERVFQLVYQVAGRVGRTADQTDVIVQTYQPTHPSVVLGLKQDYDSFYDFAIKERARMHFPPFSYLLKLTCSYASETAAIRASSELAGKLRQQYGKRINLLGPSPSFYERLGGAYRWQVVVRSSSRQTLLDIAGSVPNQKWFVDIDPSSLL